MTEKGSIVEAVKAAHEFGGDGSNWRCYAPHSVAWFRQSEYNTGRRDARIMNNERIRNAAMLISTFDGNDND